jgi:uncharacterized protein YfaS (alpha-2-macroglobulin family)/tetratricopeptide (TPR) repeat protein
MKLKNTCWLIFLVVGFLIPLKPNLAYSGEYEKLKAQAEKYYHRGSFSRARKLYIETNALRLAAKEKRWVDFRLADTLWRAEAGSKTPDSSNFDSARQQLEILIRDIKRVEDRDRVWVETQESLGDFWWLRPASKNWNSGWKHYQQALDWWAGAKDIETARVRYLKIVWAFASPGWRKPYYYYGYYGNRLPLKILENALKISQTKKDKTRAHYLIAMTLRNQGDSYQQDRVAREFLAVISAGKEFQWYDDALFQYAEWLSNYGDVIISKNGTRHRSNDYPKALAIYRRLLKEFSKGETRHYDQAKQRIKNITQPVLGVSVGNIFLPDSQIQFHLNWRNIDDAAYSIYPVDLTRDLEFDDEKGVGQWVRSIDLSASDKVLSSSHKTEDKGEYRPGQKTIRLENKLPKGAYVIEATGGGERARALILVTDSSLVLKTSGTQALVYFCDAIDGSPLAKARVSLWERYYTSRKWVWKNHTAKTNKQGLAVFSLKDSRNNGDLFASASSEDRQAFSRGTSQKYYSTKGQWKLYVFTDRPAYRPNETAHWKVIARNYDGSTYSIPANETIEFKITDPRGAKLKEGTLKLNAFGSAWGSFDLKESNPLGAYQVTFRDKEKKNTIGRATLFRLEEYKLPEFKVSVNTPSVNGKQKVFRLGDEVEVNIQAEYYFGGPVANANVEVLVYQRPFRQHWRPASDYPWYYEKSRSYAWGGKGQQVEREVLKTDAKGKATLTFKTPRNNQDLEYLIETRVTDASRREIVATGKIRVTKQNYAIYLNPAHNIHRPQDKVQINITAMDANSKPVLADGTVRVTRDYWFEIWLDPKGREVQGRELKKVREKFSSFPPPPTKTGSSWRLKFQGTGHDEILTRSVKTDKEGKALFSFTPEREGNYRVEWMGKEKDALPVQGATTVWVATTATTDLNTRHGGLEIIVDKDTFQSGQTTPVMLMAPGNDRYVLFSVEGDDLYSYQLVHMEGPVKLIHLDINEKHVPNIFLNAIMISDRQMYQDSKQVIVPPLKNFLDVKVVSDKGRYQPGEEGALTITTSNHEGHPVSAEVALGLVDASIYAIQQDLAVDPRQFFFGNKRRQRPQTRSTFQFKRYLKLAESDEGGLLDESELRNKNNVPDRFDYKKKDGVRKEFAQKLAKSSSRSRQAGMLADNLAPASIGSASLMEAEEGFAQGGDQGPAVQVRADFRATAFWQPDLVTDRNGKAKVKVKFPDSLTEWQATARVVSRNNQFGIASASTQTRKPLIVRLQAPRFFVVGDTLTVSALINNNTEKSMKVRPSINTDGLTLLGAIFDGKEVKGIKEIRVPAMSEKRIDWKVRVDTPGTAKIFVAVKEKKYSDAMEKTFIVHEHGIEKFIAKSGKMHGDEMSVRLEIPKERKKDSTRLLAQVAPSIAVTLLDSLPYLIDYPYGCTEQTMSRFLPAVITLKTLADLGLQPESIAGRIFGGIDKSAAGKTHPKGKKDLGKLNQMVDKGLKRLVDFQHGDGGWGWWKKGESDHFMSAYVLWGLTLAKDSGVHVDGDVLTRAFKFLDRELVEEETRFDQQAFMLHALASAHATLKRKKISKFQTTAFKNLWSNRTGLNAYTRSLLAVAAFYYGEKEKAEILIENLENGVKIDQTPDTSIVQRGEQKSGQGVMATAHWGEDGIHWRWSDGGVEATAFALRALILIDPDNKLIEPVTNWLVKNRRGAHWSNTRNTAIAVLALNDYLKASGELNTDLEYEIFVNGEPIARTKVEDVLAAPSIYPVDSKFIKDGANEFKIVRKNGQGPLYFSMQAKFFSLEEPITPAGNEIFLRRQYYKLVGRATLLKGLVYDRVPLNDGDHVTSGERIETLITLEAKNNYEYLIIEDLKPAGFESVKIKSGESLYARELRSSAIDRKLGKPKKAKDNLSSPSPQSSPPLRKRRTLLPSGPAQATDYTGRNRWVYQELHDRKMALFIDKLPQGIWEIRTSLRAEVPGKFHALPVMGHAMYIPQIRANGKEIRLTVKDRE